MALLSNKEQIVLFRWLETQTGLHITDANKGPVLFAVKLLCTEHNKVSAAYVSDLLSGCILPQQFIDAVTTHESFFYATKKPCKFV